MTARLLICLRFAVTIGVATVLAQARPAWPELPSSLGAPLTVTAIEQTVLLGFWIVAWVLTAGLFLRTIAMVTSIRFTQRPPHGELAISRSSMRHSRPRAVAPAPVARYAVSLPIVLDEADESDSTATSRLPAATSPPLPVAFDGATISLLGVLKIEGIEAPRREATRQLLAYLAVHREATRDQLLEALWPDEDPHRTRPRLYQSVSEAARLLGDAFIRTRHAYGLDFDRVCVDVEQLDRLIRVADSADDVDLQRAALEDALELWRGEPLAGSDYPWAHGALRHLEAVYVNLLERVAEARLASGDATAALSAAERGIAAEQLHEGFWCLAFQAEACLGQRESVQARYEALTRLLDEKLGLTPGRRTIAVYRRVLSQS